MNKYTKKLFSVKDPYNIKDSDDAFWRAIKIECERWIDESDRYRKICEQQQFSIHQLNSINDITKIPIIPTVHFKRNDLSVPHKKIIEVTSSGTSGKVSKVGYSLSELFQMLKMAIKLGRKHKLFSFRPTHYIILGYQPTKENKTVISKTAYLSTLYALPISRRFALNYKDGKYELDLDSLIDRIIKLSKKKSAVRILGFPSYTYILLEEMKRRGLSVKLPKNSKILFGGGWKQFAANEVSKEDMAAIIQDVLGISYDNVSEFFGAAEHPVLYVTCSNHRFHVPVYAGVNIRDVKTMEPVGYDQVGLVNLITPIKSSIPILSVMTDDLGILRCGKQCGCGNESDTLEILGRVGMHDVKTCSAGAEEYLKEAK